MESGCAPRDCGSRGIESGLHRRLKKLQAVPERIEAIEPVKSRQGLIVEHFHPRIAQPSPQPLEVVGEECGVRLAGGPELLLDTQVDTKVSRFEPAATAYGEMVGLGDTGYPQEALIEGHRRVFFPGRHRQLNMVEVFHVHTPSIASG